VEPNLRARLRAGDPDAFGVLFDEYTHAVYNLGFRLTANWSAAEEVVSLTFLEAWRLRGRIGPGGEALRRAGLDLQGLTGALVVVQRGPGRYHVAIPFV